ncbi:MAG: hypothetical protein EOM67_16675 [Spirochaetia bacterium]|nr:hypothetical protein [Spirochaetia bacterium]
MDKLRLYTDMDYNYKTSSEEANTCMHGCYFHGEAQHLLGHDIICVVEDIHLKHGVYDFEVIDSTDNKTIITGKLYFWKWKGLPRGLAVSEEDWLANEFAKKRFMERASSL